MRLFSSVVLAFACATVAPAQAAMTSTYGFGCITPKTDANIAGACAAGQAQLFVDVSAMADASQVLFTFRNVGAAPSSISAVYFADGTLLSIAQVINSSGVSFSQYATPPDLPNGNDISPAFHTTAGFSADSDSPTTKNGVNPGESVGILFNLKTGKTYESVLNSLALGGATGGLRIGVHAQAYTTFGNVSASFVDVPAVVPLPPGGALLALALALGGGFVAVRRRA